MKGSSGANLTPLPREYIWKVLLCAELESLTKIRQPGGAPLSLKRSRSQLNNKKASPKKPASSNVVVENVTILELQRKVQNLQKTVENLQNTVEDLQKAVAAMQEKGQKSDTKFEELAVLGQNKLKKTATL